MDNRQLLELEAKQRGFVYKYGDYWECPKCQTLVRLIFVRQHECKMYMERKGRWNMGRDNSISKR